MSESALRRDSSAEVALLRIALQRGERIDIDPRMFSGRKVHNPYRVLGERVEPIPEQRIALCLDEA